VPWDRLRTQLLQSMGFGETSVSELALSGEWGQFAWARTRLLLPPTF